MTKILIVDDDASTREFLALYLRGAGHHVVEAENPDHATTLLADMEFDLLLVDTTMVFEQDGIAFIRGQRAAGDTRPMVLMSNHRPAVTDRLLEEKVVQAFFHKLDDGWGAIVNVVADCFRQKA
jgi:DNA-binding response OmpR family regulator